MAEYKAHLIIRRLGTNEEVDRIGLTSLGEEHVEKVMRGILRQMDTDKYYIDDSEVDEARKAEQQ